MTQTFPLEGNGIPRVLNLYIIARGVAKSARSTAMRKENVESHQYFIRTGGRSPDAEMQGLYGVFHRQNRARATTVT